MPAHKKIKATGCPASLAAETGPEQFILRLYVAGTTPQSTRAILNARKLSEEHFGGRYQLEVIDIYQRPALARDEQIVAVPTLVRRLPLPLRRLVGDLSDTERVLVGLDLLNPKRAKAARKPTR
jgi:circadian clock protein KaiB